MASEISTSVLVDKCRRYITGDPAEKSLLPLIKDAIVSAEREIRDVDQPSPLAWLREKYNELFTRAYAEISAITQANPGVITAESMDDDISSDTGFSTDDIVYIDGIDGMDELNRRLFRLVRLSDTTCSLKQLNGQGVINTSGYDEYTAGGYLYHCGLKLPASTIEPSSGATDYRWKIGKVFGVTFDLFPCDPLTEEALAGDSKWFSGMGRPKRWRYQRYAYGTFETASVEHFLFFYPPANQKYNIGLSIEKTYPDISTWDTSTYPPHIPEIHDFIWHRALSNLSGAVEKIRKEVEKGAGHLDLEILHSQIWKRMALEDEIKIQNISRRLLGGGPSCGPGSGFKA